MAKHVYPVLLALLMAVAAGIQPAAAQTDARITSFSTGFASIGRDALAERTARVPVTWMTEDRPLTANLVFEQVFADGSTINVELPRDVPFVSSNGEGVAAPVLPGGDPDEIVLRVMLRSIFTGFVYDTAEITLPVVDGSGGSAGNPTTPALTAFAASPASPLTTGELASGAASVPVSWTAVNRPVTANLVFEQVLPDNRVVNVELPRENAWVNSSDVGVVAPVLPDGDVTQIVLRVRLVDLLFNRTFDQRYVYLPVEDSSPQPTQITNFESPATSITESEINSGKLIDVTWSVANRPANTNLVFEQVFTDGSIINTELPRDVTIVPSSGWGAVRTYLPTGGAGFIRVRVRLINLSSGGTITSSQFDLPVMFADDTATEEPTEEPPEDPGAATLTFSANPAPMYSTVTVAWDVPGANSVNLNWYPDRVWLPQNLVQIGNSLAPQGSHTFTLNQFQRGEVPFQVVGYNSGGGRTATVEATLQLTCAGEFFVDDLERYDFTCPVSAPIESNAAYQPFDNGFMIWDSVADKIYVGHNNGQLMVFDDNWDGTTEYTFEDVPSGRIPPARGFGKVYADNPNMATASGWPTAAEQSYTLRRQQIDIVDKYGVYLGETYLSLPDGRVLAHSLILNNTASWRMVQ